MVDKGSMCANISHKRTEGVLTMAKDEEVYIELEVKDLGYSAKEQVAQWTKSRTDEYLSEMQNNLDFNSDCMISTRFNNSFHIGGITNANVLKKLQIELFLKYPCMFEWERAPMCLNKIKSGQCHDPFVVKHIGEVFFADKYAKQK